MKRLTKDERTGATAIALVALLVCGGSILFKHLGKRTHATPEMVKSIILVSDSLDKEKNGSTSASSAGDIKKGNTKSSDKKEKVDSTAGKRKKEKVKSSSGSKHSQKKELPPRDYLSEPI